MPPSFDPEPSSYGASSNVLEDETSVIRDVWASNLEDEFKIIRKVVQRYKYVSMDTEFPGFCFKPQEKFDSIPKYEYSLVKGNINLLKIIQLGLTFQDEHGNYPYGCSTWQFNFKFNLREDVHAINSINLLRSSGIQFDRLEEEGIEPFDFAELLIPSGVVLMDDVKIITFQGIYDFGYLLKMLRGEALPEEETEFMDLLKTFFPAFYDVKYLMKSCRHLSGGLKELADQLHVFRVGHQHQAGSDSLLTGATFFRMRENFFEDFIDDRKYLSYLGGTGVSFSFREEKSNPTESAEGEG